jgi:hypothetical protein
MVGQQTEPERNFREYIDYNVSVLNRISLEHLKRKIIDQ